MKTAPGATFALVLCAVATGWLVAPAHAADVPASVDEAPGINGEPAVRRTVIEDGRTRIEELRVRGQLQQITVDPKGRAPAYQIITGAGAPDLADGVSAARGSAGKRVWNVFRF